MSNFTMEKISEQEYRNRPEASQSDFKHFRLPTPAHAFHSMNEKKDEEKKNNLLNGTCLHALVLEEKVIYEISSKCTTKKNPPQPKGGILLSAHNANIVAGMAAGIRRNRTAMKLINSLIHREVSIFWDGMKSRLDGVADGEFKGVIDLKSTRKYANEWDFSGEIQEWGIHIQGAHYTEAALIANLPCDDFLPIVVENFPPHECCVYKIGHESLVIGMKELVQLREKYFECKRTGIYPGYPDQIDEINLPRWKMKQGENE